jgi:PiT family inorganic phosphate transporter
MTEQNNHQWKTLDRDLGRISQVELAAQYVARPMVGLGVALAFIVIAALTAALLLGGSQSNMIVVAAAAFGAYMAINIGANDVANNMGPAVGANALTLGGAIVIAALCESAGALLAGGDVVSTISKGIIDPNALSNSRVFIWAMMAALISSALWVNLATWVGAPVSTTHSVVGGVMGAGIAAAGFAAVNWSSMSMIAASWVISPLLGGIIAASFLAFIKAKIIYQDDKIAAARRWVPVLSRRQRPQTDRQNRSAHRPDDRHGHRRDLLCDRSALGAPPIHRAGKPQQIAQSAVCLSAGDLGGAPFLCPRCQ